MMTLTCGSSGCCCRLPATELKLGSTESGDDRAAKEVDDLAGRRAGTEHLGDTLGLQVVGIVWRNRAPHDDQHVLGAVRTEAIHDPGYEGHVCAREYGHA